MSLIGADMPLIAVVSLSFIVIFSILSTSPDPAKAISSIDSYTII